VYGLLPWRCPAYKLYVQAVLLTEPRLQGAVPLKLLPQLLLLLLLLSMLFVVLAVALRGAVTPGLQQSPGTSGCDDSTTQPAAEQHKYSSSSSSSNDCVLAGGRR
jgi:hypothetical protein